MTAFDLIGYFVNAGVISVLVYVGGLTWSVGLREAAVLFFLVAILLAILLSMELVRFLSSKEKKNDQ